MINTPSAADAPPPALQQPLFLFLRGGGAPTEISVPAAEPLRSGAAGPLLASVVEVHLSSRINTSGPGSRAASPSIVTWQPSPAFAKLGVPSRMTCTAPAE